MQPMEELKDELQKNYYREKVIYRQRIMVVLTVIPIVIGVLLYFLTRNFGIWQDKIPFLFINTGLIGASLVGAVMMYLQTGLKRSYELNTLKAETEALNELRKQISELQMRKLPDGNELKHDIESLRRMVLDSSKNIRELSTEERANLIQLLKSQFTLNVSEEIVKEITNKISFNERSRTQASLIKERMESTRIRLTEELSSLSLRGNLNLAIGVVISIIGIYILSTFALGYSDGLTDSFSFFVHFVPRLSLVIFIEIFAYFFLRLYKNGLSEIKYFQNELTSVEAKYISLQIAASMENDGSLHKVIEKFATTERNFILEKGQSTVDLEKAKVDQKSSNDILEKIAKIINAKLQ